MPVTTAARPAAADDQRRIVTADFGVAKGVTNIDFKRGPNGEGRVIIDLTSTSISTDVWRENNVVNVELIGSQLPKELQRRMDVSDFATPISFIDSIQEGANIRMTITRTVISNTSPTRPIAFTPLRSRLFPRKKRRRREGEIRLYR